MLKVVKPGYPCLVVTAEHTSPEFVKQSRKYHKVLMESGIKVHFIHLADEDHLSVSQVLSDEDSFLMKVLTGFMASLQARMMSTGCK
jgi:acetyl esterase/lipase